MFTPKTKNPVNYYLQGFQFAFCDPAGTRTQGPNIKSVVLYQLSYEIDLFSSKPARSGEPSLSVFGRAKIRVAKFCSKSFLLNKRANIILFQGTGAIPAAFAGNSPACHALFQY